MDYQHLLGTMPDADIARQLGISRQMVSKTRKRLGIPVYKKPIEPILHDKCGGLAAVFECYNDSGSQRYRCQKCGAAFTPYPTPRTICDRPLTPYERVKRSQQNKKSKRQTK